MVLRLLLVKVLCEVMFGEVFLLLLLLLFVVLLVVVLLEVLGRFLG